MTRAASLCACVLGTLPVSAAQLPTLVEADLPQLVRTYKSLHAHPELSHQEAQSSALLATELRKAGFAVTERVGRYPDGSQAYGVVAILQNGPGPRLLIRTDMDALPVIEETGAAYASKVRTRNTSGQEVGVMHACGHDVHMTALLGTARALVALKDHWHGTLMLVGQPSEETIDGAKAMLADQIYQRFGTPDMAVALHDTNTRPAGTVGITSGPALASSTSVDVLLRGIGGHGAVPQESKDPVVMAAAFIMQLQTIVSRQENPREPTVITVGSIHGGRKRNIIPDEVKLELTTRSFSEHGRQIVLDGIEHTARGVALAAGVPEDRAPVVTVLEHESTSVTYNDPTLTARVKAALESALGADRVSDDAPVMASEDFGAFGLEGHKIPSAMFWLGAINPAQFSTAQAAGTPLPALHSSRFQPDPEPTLRTGVTAMTSVAIALLQR